MPAIFECKSTYHCSLEKLFSFHEDPIGFETLVALDKSVKVLQAPTSIEKIGTQAILEVTLFPLIKKKWIAEHIGYKKNEIFIDIQKEGPFLFFRHEHRFSKDGEYSVLTDHIEFEFFLNPISKYFVAQKIKSQFKARHKATADYLQVEYKNTFCGLV
jgi:ligand-binding SRPBCC domain-containing protein